MNAADRRGALRMAAAFALAPMLLRAGPGAARSSSPVALPPGPMVLTRRLHRELSDGATILLQRRWTIRFLPTAPGYKVEGHQLDASVEAPPSLAALAKIEQARVADDRFPLQLDATGMIVGASRASDSSALDKAAKAALDMVRRARLSDARRQDATRMLAAIQHSTNGMLGQMPADFFVPGNDRWEEERSLALPGGLRGTVRVRFSASCVAGSALLASSHRAIETAIGQSVRHASEDWSLASA